MKHSKKIVRNRNALPWRSGNEFFLLKDGHIFYPRMLETIDTALHYVLLEMYLFESGNVGGLFIDTLCRTAKRGIIVCLLLDDFGSRTLNRADRQRLTAGGVSLCFFNPLRYGKWLKNLHRNHRKLLIVDGQIAFTGGAGITDAFSPDYHPDDFWRETMLEISGPVVADWQHAFEALWRGEGNPFLPNLHHFSRHSDLDIAGRVTLLQPPERRGVIGSLIKRMRRAKKRIWIETAYFIPTWKIRRAMKKAARAGIDVRLLLPGARTDHPPVRRISQRYYQPLLRNGVKIYEFSPRFMHSKIMLCDDWVSMGSSNLDRWSLRWNLEANQEVNDADFAESVKQLLESDFLESREITYHTWTRRRWHLRFLENFWMSVMVWTEYLLKLRESRLTTAPRRQLKQLFRRNKKKLS